MFAPLMTSHHFSISAFWNSVPSRPDNGVQSNYTTAYNLVAIATFADSRFAVTCNPAGDVLRLVVRSRCQRAHCPRRARA